MILLRINIHFHLKLNYLKWWYWFWLSSWSWWWWWWWGGQIYFKGFLCVSSHSKDFIVLAKKKIINCQNRTGWLYDGPVLLEWVHVFTFQMRWLADVEHVVCQRQYFLPELEGSMLFFVHQKIFSKDRDEEIDVNQSCTIWWWWSIEGEHTQELSENMKITIVSRGG